MADVTKSKVAVAKCNSYDAGAVDAAVSQLIALLGGMETLLGSPKSVLIKPNVFGILPHETATATHPVVIAAVIKELQKLKSVERIIVAEHSGMNMSARRKLERSPDLKPMCEALGVELVPLDEEEHPLITVPNGKRLPTINLPKLLFEVDAIINMPKMKTVGIQAVSLGFKNLMGIVRLPDRQKLHRTDMAQGLVDLVKAVRQDLTIIDGILAMEGDGPGSGTPIKAGVIVGGADIVSVDSVGAAIMGMNPLEDDAARLAQWEGLGKANLEQIDVVGASIEEVRKPFKRPTQGIVGAYKNAEVLMGGTCIGCQENVRNALNMAQKAGLLNKMTTVILGKDPPVPAKLMGEEVFVIGDCAGEHRRLGAYVPGCPPFPGESSRRFRQVLIKRNPQPIIGPTASPAQAAAGDEEE